MDPPPLLETLCYLIEMTVGDDEGDEAKVNSFLIIKRGAASDELRLLWV